MKLLFDLLPVIAFFIAFKIPADPQEGVLLATAVAIICAVIQTAYLWFRHRRVEKMQLITVGIIVILGGLTLVFRDERFIKWKPTLVNWAFAIAFFVSAFISDKPLVRRMMENAVVLPERTWTSLNYCWVVFFLLMGCANLYVAYNFSTEIWVNFKLFGVLGLTVVFVLLQSFYLMRHLEEPEKTKS
jgi:intracellular septation protein